MNFTDDKIAKAFECCYMDKPCSECPFYQNDKCILPTEKSEELPEMIVNIINRLKTENSELKNQIEKYKKISRSDVNDKAHS